jgi:hypothetical protein
MCEHEVRILRRDGSLALVVSQFQHPEIAAIKSARQLAKNKTFEFGETHSAFISPPVRPTTTRTGISSVAAPGSFERPA